MGTSRSRRSRREHLQWPTPPICQLPAEMRQLIFGHVLREADLTAAYAGAQNINKATARLSLTCRSIRDDMRRVRFLWEKRRQAILRKHGQYYAGADTLVRELMGPINHLAKMRTKEIAIKNAKAKAKKKDRKLKKLREAYGG